MINICRVDEPKLLSGSSAYESPSVRVQKEYEIETTQLPGWPGEPTGKSTSTGSYPADHYALNMTEATTSPSTAIQKRSRTGWNVLIRR